MNTTTRSLAASSTSSRGFDLKEWLLDLVMHSHPEWRRADGSCPECDAEIEQMRERADSVKVDFSERHDAISF